MLILGSGIETVLKLKPISPIWLRSIHAYACYLILSVSWHVCHVNRVTRMILGGKKDPFEFVFESGLYLEVTFTLWLFVGDFPLVTWETCSHFPTHSEDEINGSEFDVVTCMHSKVENPAFETLPPVCSSKDDLFSRLALASYRSRCANESRFKRFRPIFSCGLEQTCCVSPILSHQKTCAHNSWTTTSKCHSHSGCACFLHPLFFTCVRIFALRCSFHVSYICFHI